MSGHDMWRLQKATSDGQDRATRHKSERSRTGWTIGNGIMVIQSTTTSWAFSGRAFYSVLWGLVAATRDGQAGRDKVRCHLYQHNILERYLAHHQQHHLGILPVVLFEACSLVAHSEIARSVVLFIFRYISPTDTITQ